jgi:hypothetical protein
MYLHRVEWQGIIKMDVTETGNKPIRIMLSCVWAIETSGIYDKTKFSLMKLAGLSPWLEKLFTGLHNTAI